MPNARLVHAGTYAGQLSELAPPKEAIEARRRAANRVQGDNDHYHTVANPAKGEKPGERGAKPTGYRPERKSKQRRQGKKKGG